MTFRELLTRYRAGAAAVTDALAGVTPDELDRRPGPGAWTAREIVHHLADSEANAYVRLRHLLGDGPYTVQAYDQDGWAANARLAYDRPVERSLAVLHAVRASSAELLERLTEADLARAAVHPEHDEPYTVARWLQLYTDHPHDHADQIRRARRGAP